jgi:c(7)-type cytochrome triheme protein
VTVSIRGIAALLTVAVLVHLDACTPPDVKPAATEARLPPKPPAAPAVRPAEAAPDQDLYYDPANPDYAVLQKANQALAGFPLDATGKVDWMQALRSGLIQPRQDLNGSSQMTVLDLDVIMKDTKEMPYVLFPHKSHTLWLVCSNCHPAIFEPRAGAVRITMNDIFRGKYCGTCHDRVAFVTYFSCERCHRVPHGESAGSGTAPAR